MRKLNFFEKNDALQLLQEEKHFDADCATLARLNPASKLQNEIANVNQFNKSSLHGRILFELLDLATIDAINEARVKGYSSRHQENDPPPKKVAAKPVDPVNADPVVPAKKVTPKADKEKKKSPKA